MEAISGEDWAEPVTTAAGVAFDFPVGDESRSPAARMPRRIRRRLGEVRSGPSTSEEIAAKLRDADLRRQQFHEWLSSKARPKPRSPSWSSQEDDLGQRLEARLYAAEQKRISIITEVQMRLARLDELRQAAKNGVEQRFEEEREKLGTKVECRVQQARANRMHLHKMNLQRRAVVKERTARSLLQRVNRDNKYRERIRMAIHQKRAAAEKKRLRLLEAEQKRAHSRVAEVRRVAKLVCHQREVERRKKKEQLEERLQRAKQQRAEYLKQRGNPSSYKQTVAVTFQNHGDLLSRKLARSWKKYVKTQRTTMDLAKDYQALGINGNIVRVVPFEQLASLIQSSVTLKTVKSLLDRLESRFMLLQTSDPFGPKSLDHLLKHVGSPSKRGSPSEARRSKGETKRGSKKSKPRETQKPSRYAVRVVLCAYMILGHPDAVLSGQGECENELAESAASFVREFELLTSIILNGPLRHPSPNAISDAQGSSNELPKKHCFRSQLAAFDAAWRSYLYRFVVWKVKDARSLEDDLVRAACQLELSMMHTCKFTSEGQDGVALTHDMKAVQKEVNEDQRLLREKVKHLSGDAGIERMETALTDARSKFFEAKENGSSTFTAPVSHISSPLLPTSSEPSTSSSEKQDTLANGRRAGSVVRSLFADGVPSLLSDQDISMKDVPSSSEAIPFGNELLVNEFLHESHALADGYEAIDKDEVILKAKIKEAMEKAYWDGIMDSLSNEQPDYGRIVALVKEVRDELCELAPQIWKQDIRDSIDVDILTQLLESGTYDIDYLGKILEYALSMLRKLSAPANEDEMAKTHHKLLMELSDIAQPIDKLSSSFIAAVVKALRFVLDEIQVLKEEISKARIQMMVPIIKGPAGVEYLMNSFINRYGPPIDASNRIPLTAQWISSVRDSSSSGEWDEHTQSVPSSATSQYLPHATALRSGGSIVHSTKGTSSSLAVDPSVSETECKGEPIDLLLRIGLLKLVCGTEGLTKEKLPETLSLNFSRLRAVQGNLQSIIVVATSMLVLRQILYSENITMETTDLGNTISSCAKTLYKFLNSTQDVGIVEIIDTIVSASLQEKLAGKREVMAKVLIKSLQAGDAVFEGVSKSVYLACRGIVLGGTGEHGRSLASSALSRIGASVLVDQFVDSIEKVIVMAKVSGEVHRSWYESLLQN